MRPRKRYTLPADVDPGCLLNFKQVHEACPAVSIWMLYRWHSKKILPTYRLDGRLVVNAGQFESWINGRLKYA